MLVTFAVVETDSPWVDACIAGKAGTAPVIGALPVIKDERCRSF